MAAYLCSQEPSKRHDSVSLKCFIHFLHLPFAPPLKDNDHHNPTPCLSSLHLARVEHPEVNSRRPGRFELRLREAERGVKSFY
ncbi:hypothetical protein LDENG_00002260 [Lucifuga dentata]|nr:hypothetical protein LDENG_00002260 [Lucifuga dentata]